jgi:hypothetical protein
MSVLIIKIGPLDGIPTDSVFKVVQQMAETAEVMFKERTR